MMVLLFGSSLFWFEFIILIWFLGFSLWTNFIRTGRNCTIQSIFLWYCEPPKSCCIYTHIQPIQHTQQTQHTPTSTPSHAHSQQQTSLWEWQTEYRYIYAYMFFSSFSFLRFVAKLWQKNQKKKKKLNKKWNQNRTREQKYILIGSQAYQKSKIWPPLIFLCFRVLRFLPRSKPNKNKYQIPTKADNMKQKQKSYREQIFCLQGSWSVQSSSPC